MSELGDVTSAEARRGPKRRARDGLADGARCEAMGEERNWHERERTGREAFFFLMDQQAAGGFSRNPATRRPWKHDKLGIVEDHKGAASTRRHDLPRRKQGAQNQNPPCTANPLGSREAFITCISIANSSSPGRLNSVLAILAFPKHLIAPSMQLKQCTFGSPLANPRRKNWCHSELPLNPPRHNILTHQIHRAP